MYKLIILCLLGDPDIPAASVKHTGGFQVDIQELLTNISHFNCDVHVITNTSEYCSSAYEIKSNYTIHRISFQESWLDNQEEMMQNYHQIKDCCFGIVQQLLEDKILIHSFYWLSGMIAEELSRELNINYVHSPVSLAIGKILGGSKPYFSQQFEQEKIFLYQASHIFSITNAESEQLQTFYNVPKDKITIVGRDVHPAFLSPCRDFDGTPYSLVNTSSKIATVELMKYPWWTQGAFTYVGRLQTIKGLHHIITAWLTLYEKYGECTPPLWICGGTPENIKTFRNELISLLNEALLIRCENNQKIIWWGYLDAAGISTLFLKTRVMITHSQYEPGGRVLLEALAASVPVIATPNGFAKDIIKNNYNGFLIKFGQIEELSNVMAQCMNNTDTLINMKRNARKTFLFHRNQWACYEKQLQIYIKFGMQCFAEDS